MSEFFDTAAAVYAGAPRTRNFQSRRDLFWEAARVARERATDARVCLDLGCGPGPLTQMLVGASFNVTGCDSSPEMLARAQLASPSAEFVQADIVPFLQGFQGEADLVVCSSVLEYLDDPAEVVRLVARRLRPGGVFAVSVPARWSVSRLLQRAVMLKTPRQERYTSQWRNRMSASELAQTGARCGLRELYRRNFGSFEYARVRLPFETRRPVATMTLVVFSSPQRT